MIGTARTIRSELSIDFATCEVDDMDSSSSLIADVFIRFQAREEDKTLQADFEYAIRNGTVHVGRFYPFALSDDLLIAEPEDKISS